MKGGGGRSITTKREVPYDNYHAGSSGKSGAADTCVLSFFTNLEKPTSAAAKLSSGDILTLKQELKNQIGAYGLSSMLCGYVFSTSYHKRMLDCMSNGRQYEAEVKSITATSIEILVYGGK